MTPDDATLLKSLSDGVQHARAEADARWGVDRLRLLVSDELRLRFDKRAEAYGRALEACWASGERMLSADQLSGMQAEATRMRTALARLDEAATADGADPLSPQVWEIPLHDGTVAAFCRDTASAVAVRAQGRAVSVWTPQEVANLIAALPELISQAKGAFPGACVVAPMHRAAKFVADPEVPFG